MAFYELKARGRCIVGQPGESSRHCFFGGTANVKDSDNEIHHFEYVEERACVQPIAIYSHPVGEVFALSACPTDANLLLSSYENESRQRGVTLWQLKKEHISPEPHSVPLTPVAQLAGHQETVKSLFWGAEEQTVLSIDSSSAKLWKMATPAQPQAAWSIAGLNQCEAGALDPHHPGQFILSTGSHIRLYDTRAQKEVSSITNAHAGLVTDVDFNPNKPYTIVTAGDDRLIKFWDLKKACDASSAPPASPVPAAPSARASAAAAASAACTSSAQPLKILTGHSHWVTRARFNSFHDQLVLSAGTDAKLNLWNVSSICSAPLDLSDGDSSFGMGSSSSRDREPDHIVQSFEEHEESIYSVAWSCCDAWVFASLSYDGRVAVSQVAVAEKYKILL